MRKVFPMSCHESRLMDLRKYRESGQLLGGSQLYLPNVRGRERKRCVVNKCSSHTQRNMWQDGVYYFY